MDASVAPDEAAEDGPELESGASFGRYTVVGRIGRGGFGEVYEAVHRELGKRVALKVLRREFAVHPTVRARFTREAQVASRLRHPHVLDVTDVGVCDARPFLVMELLEGETLRALLEREGALAPARAVDLLLPVLDAVALAHERGIVHRDLKPENIFLAREGPRGGVPKVLDFGVVKLEADGVRGGAMLTGSGVLLGTPSYMSPEQAQDVRDLDGRSDQFALGAIAYECLAGRRAFAVDGVLATLQRVTSAEPEALPGTVPDALGAAVARALRKSPGARFASLREFASALLPFASPTARAEWSAAMTEAASGAPAAAEDVPGSGTLQGHTRSIRHASRVGPGAGLAVVVVVAVVAVAVSLRPNATTPGPSQVAIARPAPVPPSVAAPVPPSVAAPVPPSVAAPVPPSVAAPVPPSVAAPIDPPARTRVASTPRPSRSAIASRAATGIADAGAPAAVAPRLIGTNGALIED